MGKFDGILLCSDFDRTLACEGAVSEENCEAIKYFQENGGLFTMVSGRFPEFFIREFWDRFRPNTHIIGLNGAAIFDPDSGRRVWWNKMPNDTYKKSFEVFHKYSDKIRYLWPHMEFASKKVSIEEEYDDSIADCISKIAFSVKHEYSDLLARELIPAEFDPEIFVVERASIGGVELLLKENTKGMALRRLRGMLGDRVETVVAIGDYENDFSMLKEADIGYAVANARDDLKAIADRITVDCKDHAIAKIISEL